MTRLLIRHETVYDYERPVAFTPHRLMLRSHDSHANRLVGASLELFPQGQTRWVYDANEQLRLLVHAPGRILTAAHH